MWSSTCTTVGIIAKLVDVHASLCRGVTAFDVIGNGRWGSLGGLLKGNGTADGGITTKYCDCGRGCCQQRITKDCVALRGTDGVPQSLFMSFTHRLIHLSSNGAIVPSQASDNVLNLARMAWQGCGRTMLGTMVFTCFDHVCRVSEGFLLGKQFDVMSLERNHRMCRSGKEVQAKSDSILSGNGRSKCLIIQPSGVSFRRKDWRGKSEGLPRRHS